MNELAKRIAHWIYFEASAYTDTGGWSVYYCEIEEEYGVDLTPQMIGLITAALEDHPGVAEVSLELDFDPCITVSLWDCYCGIVEEYKE